MTDNPRKKDWLARSLRAARVEVASWPEWKKDAMRVTRVSRRPVEELAVCLDRCKIVLRHLDEGDRAVVIAALQTWAEDDA